MAERRDIIEDKDFFHSLSGLPVEMQEIVIRQIARTEWQQLRYPDKWNVPLGAEDIEALNTHPYLSALTAEFPDRIREDVRDFFARGLRAGVDFDPEASIRRDPSDKIVNIQDYLNRRNNPSDQ